MAKAVLFAIFAVNRFSACCCKKKSDRRHSQSFYSAISQEDRDWLIAEEKYNRDVLGITKTSDDTLEKLKSTAPGRRVMVGCPFYDILANPEYRSKYEYFTRGAAEEPKDFSAN